MLNNFIVKFLIIFLCVIFKNSCNSQCIFENFDNKYPPVFINKYDKRSYNLLQNFGTSINILEDVEVLGYCRRGLTLRKGEKGIRRRIAAKDFKLRCIENKLFIELYSKTYEDKTFNRIFSCAHAVLHDLHEKFDVDGCTAKNYAVTTPINNLTIVLAEACFDLSRMKLNYIHFTARSSSFKYMSDVKKIIAQHKDEKLLDESDIEASTPNEYEDTNRTKRLLENKDEPDFREHSFIKTSMPMSVFFFTNKEFKSLLPDITPYKHITFLSADLYPNKLYYNFVATPFILDLRPIQKFIGWQNLILGNWLWFHQLLARQVGEQGSYEVYIGVSDVAIIPNIDELCVKKLILEKNMKKLNVPKFLWTYVHSSVADNDDFVAIGINSPFFEFHGSNFPCADICHEITWMKPLNDSRRVYNLGYLFCCRVNEVENFLEGFPKIRRKHYFAYE